MYIYNICCSPLKINLNSCIARQGIARPQSKFLHSCVCQRSIYSHFCPPVFLQQNRQTDCENIEVAHRSMNVGIGTVAAQCAVPFLGIFGSSFRYCVFAAPCSIMGICLISSPSLCNGNNRNVTLNASLITIQITLLRIIVMFSK